MSSTASSYLSPSSIKANATSTGALQHKSSRYHQNIIQMVIFCIIYAYNLYDILNVTMFTLCLYVKSPLKRALHSLKCGRYGDGVGRVSGIILACAMCAMAHTFHIRRRKIKTVRRNGARFSRMAHEKLACALFSCLIYTCLIYLCK